jgi:hypothetical protein
MSGKSAARLWIVLGVATIAAAFVAGPGTPVVGILAGAFLLLIVLAACGCFGGSDKPRR